MSDDPIIRWFQERRHLITFVCTILTIGIVSAASPFWVGVIVLLLLSLVWMAT